MPLQPIPTFTLPGGADGGLLALPIYILNTFFPAGLAQLSRHPRTARFLSALLALFTVVPWTYRQLSNTLGNITFLLCSSISICSDEDLFDHLAQWLVNQRTIRKDQALTATTNGSQERGRRGYDDLDRLAASSAGKIQYQQSQGSQLFIFRGRIFVMERKYGDGSIYRDRRSSKTEVLTLTCSGRSTQPIKELLQEVHQLHKEEEKFMTIIRRPASGDFGGSNAWSRVTAKSRRDMGTVILDSLQKSQIIADIDEYLDPSTRTWYADRGIPYRRGYLFHGPPGTGKTSFAMALASRLSVDIFVISLLDREVRDSDLIILLNQLPPRCLLLLEDIDTAGLSRQPKMSMRGRRRRPMPSLNQNNSSDEEGETGSSSNITLSGLLNAIDGVAAPEGHILIMTTNKPDELDEALVRSGRISVKVEFRNSSHTQAQDIFLRMYQHQFKDAERQRTDVSPGLSHDQLLGMARMFAETIPENEFSPADLQDYLLMRKKEPQRALDELEAWKTKTLAERAKKAEEQEKEKVERRRRTGRARAETTARPGEGNVGDGNQASRRAEGEAEAEAEANRVRVI